MVRCVGTNSKHQTVCGSHMKVMVRCAGTNCKQQTVCGSHMKVTVRCAGTNCKQQNACGSHTKNTLRCAGTHCKQPTISAALPLRRPHKMKQKKIIKTQQIVLRGSEACMRNNGGHFECSISAILMKFYSVDAIKPSVIFVPCRNTIT